MDKRQSIYNFLTTQLHMVVATVTPEGNPEAALVGFGHTDDLRLIFGTSKLSRKYKNLQNNSHVAIVFGNQEGITVQYEGVISPLEGEELTTYKEIYFTKNPQSKKYETYDNQIYIKVTPTWIRYTDYKKTPEEVFEINL